MSQRTPDSGSPYRADPADFSPDAPGARYQWPGPDTPGARDEEEPDPDWPGDVPPAAPWLAPPGRGALGDSAGRRSAHPLTLAAIAVVAAAVGVVAALLIANKPASTPSATPSSPPSAAAPAVGGGGAITGGGNGGAGEQLFLAGKVTAVSPTSITISGQGQQFTAAITSSTKFTGVSGASRIKTGDLVALQVSGYGTGHEVATAVQDPAQLP
jgi:hypothetical protein